MRLKNSKTKIVLSVVGSVAVVALMLMLMFNSGIDSLMKISGFVVIPVQQAVISVSDSIGSFFSGFGEKTALSDENNKLKQELAEAQLYAQQINQIIKENTQLKEMLGEKERYQNCELLFGSIIVSKTDTYTDTYTINKGSRDGVEKDMVVLAPGGLAGRVISVSESYCIMMSIIDSRSSIPSIVERTRDTGITKGYSVTGQVQNSCNMVFLPLDAKSISGDSVITSGRGDVFPKGIQIGALVEVSLGSTTLGTTAVLKPAVDFDHLEYVFILLEDGVVPASGNEVD